MSDGEDNKSRNETPILSYRKDPAPEWSRFLLRHWFKGILLFVAVFAFITLYPRLAAKYVQIKLSGEIMAWQQRAKINTLQKGTLIYSEHPDEVNQSTSGYQYFDAIGKFYAEKEIRQIPFVYYGSKYPSLNPAPPGQTGRVNGERIIFTYERPSTTGRNQFIVIRYGGPNPSTHQPCFDITSYNRITSRFQTVGASMYWASALDKSPRSMIHLRMYAGYIDPVDKTTIYIPFDCDSGKGTFEFKLPAITINWDSNSP